ncbi:MAG TPA: PspC domain-containing protein [Bryobacteraceae bacterium]|nr:PspC domain-containing protein [Bryobacteraceae bacterium]
MYCTHCGLEVPANASYCWSCGGITPSGEQKRQSSEYAPQRVFRLTRERKIAGVCAGFARYLNLDVTLVRLLFVMVMVLTGFIPGLVTYILAWIIMPVDSGYLRPANVAEPAHAK